MHFAMSSYEQMDIFHFGIDNKPINLLVTVGHPYDIHEFVPKVMRIISRAGG